MAWRSFNLLNDVDVQSRSHGILVLDTRPLHVYAAGHIRGSVCVHLLDHNLCSVAGPGPPTWYPNCWWDRRVLLVLPPRSRKRKTSSSGYPHPVFRFLREEGLVKSLHVLESDREGEDDAFSIFAKDYPFLITKSTKSTKTKNYPTEVIPGLLFLGDLTHATDQNCLESLQISHVLTIHTEPLKLPNLIEYTFFELDDDPSADIVKYFEPMHDLIERVKKLNKRVLVHCGAGISRSATLCVAYLMRVKHWTVEEALKFLQDQRSKVNPNPGFLSALHNYHCTLKSNACNSKPTSAGIVRTVKDSHLDVMKDGKLIGGIPLGKGELSFGRGKDCNVILEHASISRHHAVVMPVATDGEDEKNHVLERHSLLGRKYCSHCTCFQLVDSSTHGTYVNGARLSKESARVLNVGDVITFGGSTRKYVFCDGINCFEDSGSGKK